MFGSYEIQCSVNFVYCSQQGTQAEQNATNFLIVTLPSDIIMVGHLETVS